MFDDERFEMVRRLLSRAYDEEIKIADAVAATMAKETGLPPYQYTTTTSHQVGTSGYVYARNLVATRLYQCPVVYFEPYVMNNGEASRAFRPEIMKERAPSMASNVPAFSANTPNGVTQRVGGLLF